MEHIIFITILICIYHIIPLGTYGGLLNKQKCKSLEKLNKSNLRFSLFSADTIVYNNRIYIHKAYPNLFGKYYIDGIGIIPRWSKASKNIDKYFDDLFEEGMN